MATLTLTIPVLVCYYSPGPSLTASRSYKYVANVEYYHEASSSTVLGVETFFTHLARSKPRRLGLSHTELESAEVSVRLVKEPLFSPDASDATIAQTVNDEAIRRKTSLIDGRMKLSGTEDKLVVIISVPTLVDDQQATPASVAIANKLPHREAIAAASRKRRSPSSGATVSELMQTQTSSHLDAIYNYRPLHLAPPPITIYHPAFARFAQSMSQPADRNIQYTPAEVQTAREFIQLSSRLYVDESSRQRAIRAALSDAVGIGILDSTSLNYSSGRFQPDGVIRTDTSFEGFRPVVTITEVTNEIGTGSCDPRAQAECAYVAVYASFEAEPIRNVCCCPALLLAIAGPYIAVSGAAFADQLIAQPFTGYMPITPLSPHGLSAMSEAILSMARLFRALKRCIDDLKTYYAGLRAKRSIPSSHSNVGAQRTSHARLSSTTSTSAGALKTSSGASKGMASSGTSPASPSTLLPYVGPSFDAYTDDNGQRVELRYVARLAADYSSKAVFIADARVTDKEDKAAFKVVVKFTEAYGRDVHRVAHEGGFAPKLHYCEKVESVGMWVVVTDFVASVSVHVSSIAEPLRKAVRRLHDKGFVFGDLREPNVLVTEEGEVQLIDFDWGGHVGEARYPYDIAITRDHGWHADVRPGGLITEGHDAHMFECLTGELL